MNNSLSNEFLDLLSSVIDKLRNRLFFINFNDGTTRDRYKSIEFLVKSLCFYEKYFPDKCNVPELFDLEFLFFKSVLEHDAPLFVYEKDVFDSLGIKRDRSGLSLPEENRIEVQSLAQILWNLEGIKIPTIEAMRQRLQERTWPLNIKRIEKKRTIEDWVRPIFPVPVSGRKKHRLEKEKFFSEVVPIPGIFSVNGVNFQKLHFAAICLTRILKTLGWNYDQILRSKFIYLLVKPLKYDIQLIVKEWVREAFLSNSSIFTS